MKASTKRALSLLLAVALIIAAFVIYAVLISPEYETVKNLRGTLLSKTSIYEKEKQAIVQVQNLIAQYQGTARLEDQLSLALPREEAVSSIMSQLNAISQLSGISMQSAGLEYLPFKPSPAALSSARNIGSLRLDLRLFGPYAAFKTFLSDLEKNVRVMDVKNLKIDQGGDADQDIFVYTLTVDTYYQSK